MSTIETEEIGSVQEVKLELSSFMKDLKGFQADINSKLQYQEERLTMLDRKSLTLSAAAMRPALSASREPDLSHKTAFTTYVRNGDDEALRGLALEGKSMSTAVNGDGGYLVDPQTSEMIKSVLKSTASIRSIANVVNVEATSYDVLIDTTDLGSGWVTETGSLSETDTPTIDRISIPLYELSALPKASQRLLDDSAFDIEAWLAGRIADKFASAEAMAAAFNQEMGRLQATVAETGREVSKLESGISRGLKRAIDGLVFDGDTLSDALRGLGTSMLDAAYNAALTPVTSHLGSALGSGLEGIIQGLMPFERGGAFAQGRVMPFAKGGVVTSPSYFPMRGAIGLMGEAGAEAILPLTRGANGRLGVEAQGRARPVNITMNVTTPDVQGFRRSQSQIAAQLSRALGRGSRNQ
ncbi:phage major capsid protein [Celeribacter neptunius]|uniref:Phage major capsid protein, HK97 family n=1 Tax=Celeribacter neptunius TaxID=588602 RepID=A0A1I3K1D3_9RHOB|nr:phage major capsid protein [Celeribacter neptunius]SFI66110.1 phage major capsid protein, HK97 family [Celeribacter neptunius]